MTTSNGSRRLVPQNFCGAILQDAVLLKPAARSASGRFAHTVGEFGVVRMIGGNIAGRTGVVTVANPTASHEENSAARQG